MRRTSPLPRIQDLAQEQWGLVTRRQMAERGVGPTTVERLIAGSVIERVATGVYHITAAPIPDNLDLRAAWLQLAPDIPVWARVAPQGVVSHRSAAALYGLGDLPADRHEFTLSQRKQTARHDVRIHTRPLRDGEWISVRGLPVTRPSRIASDMLWDGEEPEKVSQIIAGAIRHVSDYPGTFADSLAPHALRRGFRRGDGIGVLRWLLDLCSDADVPRWIDEARSHVARRAPSPAAVSG